MFTQERWPKQEVKIPGSPKVVMLISVAFEAEENHGLMDESHIDFMDFYERQYGGRRGVWRILDALERNDVKATFCLPGAVAENYPDACRAAGEAGHEFIAHGYHHEHLERYTAEEEDAVFLRTLDVFGEYVGLRPQGFRTCFPSHRTIDFVLEHGYQYDTTHRDEDLPYLLEWPDGRTLLEIPRNVNGDLHTIGSPGRGRSGLSAGRYSNTRTVVEDHFKHEFLAHYEAGSEKPQIMGLTLHPFVSGHPSRAKAVSDFLAFTKEFPDIWYATHGELADLWLQQEFGEAVGRTATAYSDMPSR